MKVFKIPLHSIIDVITNSSTEIFTFYGQSVEPAKELIAEILKTFNVDKSVDEVFKVFVLAQEVDSYLEEGGGDKYWPVGMTEDKVVELYEAVGEGKIEKPDWFNEVEQDEDIGWYEYAPPTNELYLISQDEKYNELAEKLQNFLFSPESIECGC